MTQHCRIIIFLKFALCSFCQNCRYIFQPNVLYSERMTIHHTIIQYTNRTAYNIPSPVSPVSSRRDAEQRHPAVLSGRAERRPRLLRHGGETLRRTSVHRRPPLVPLPRHPKGKTSGVTCARSLHQSFPSTLLSMASCQLVPAHSGDESKFVCDSLSSRPSVPLRQVPHGEHILRSHLQ